MVGKGLARWWEQDVAPMVTGVSESSAMTARKRPTAVRTGAAGLLLAMKVYPYQAPRVSPLTSVWRKPAGSAETSRVRKGGAEGEASRA
mgnify:CR=1 FL=1